LNNLEQHQLEYPFLFSIQEKLINDPNKFQEKYMIKNEVLHCKDQCTYPYWMVMLPKSLEYQVIKYTHNVLGHQGLVSAYIIFHNPSTLKIWVEN
jgi:hypothetical protein